MRHRGEAQQPATELLLPAKVTENETGWSGRSIEGLRVTPERFSLLQEGRDYEVVEKNGAISAERPLTDFFVFINPTTGEQERRIEPPHWRTVSDAPMHATFTMRKKGATEFYDEMLHFYDVNTKGVGYLKPSVKGENVDSYDTWVQEDQKQEQDFGHKVKGLSSKDDYWSHGSILNRSQYLAQQGLRTEVYWGVAKLKQLWYKGALRSIDSLRAEGVILPRRDYQPHMAVRLLKTNSRIAEAWKGGEGRAKELFKKAFEVFNKERADAGLEVPELTWGDKKSEQVYFLEFFRRMGENMAVLLNTGYSHYHIHSANVTLAAEIVDVGSASYWKLDPNNGPLQKKYGGVRGTHIKDMRDMVYNLKYLRLAGREAGISRPDREECKDTFFEGFDRSLRGDHVKKIEKTDPAKAREWLEKIFDAVVLENKRLAPLLHNELKSWPIEVT